ncbi:MAG TPA: hypothetical protein VMR99_02020 [Candidatus Paceibacterota bacterium]|nr:hypothetical protein [Candidatus Paceibacterota bacterium]
MEEMHGQGNVCKCPHHKSVPALIILIGLDFLLGAVGVLTMGFVGITWPILLILVGCVKMVKCNCCAK